MFIRKNKNRSGSVSIQIVKKVKRSNKVIKTVGVARTKREEELLLMLAKAELERISGLSSLFVEHDDLVIESFVEGISNDHSQIVGPEIILGKIYEKTGLPEGGSCNYFKYLVLCRLVYAGSKLKTVDYFTHHLNLQVSVYTIYRFLDELESGLKKQIEEIAFDYTRSGLQGNTGVVFYDMMTLYFEASEEDDYRISGFSKDGKHQHPQILIGLLFSSHGYPIGYKIFEGNTSETKTLIPVLKSFQKRFDLDKPVVIADAALLSKKNIDALRAGKFKYILVNLTTDTVTGWELNRHHPTAKFAKEIIAFLGHIPVVFEETSLGQQLWWARLVTGMTQKQVAEHIGCDASNLRYIELGQRQPRSKVQEKLQSFFYTAFGHPYAQGFA